MITDEIWEGLNDGDLVERACRPESRVAALGEIYRRYSEQITRYCIGRLKEKDSAPDAAHDTFAALAAYFADGRSLDNPGALRGFLYRIAERRAMTYMRGGTSGRRHRQPLDMLGLVDVTELAADTALLAQVTGGDTPDEIVQTEEELGLERVRYLLDSVIVPTLNPRHQRIYEQSVHRGLAGQALADSLGMTTAKAKNNASYVRGVTWRGFAAFVLFENGREQCTDLDRIIANAISRDGDVFTQALREEITHHFDTCKTCQKCQACGVLRLRLVAKYAPALVPLLYAVELRERVTETVRQVCAQTRTGASTAERPPEPPLPPGPRRRRAAGLALPLLAALLIIGALVFWPRQPHHIAAAATASVLPAIAYANPAGVMIRAGKSPPRMVGVPPKGFKVVRLTWSADGTQLAWMAQNGDESATQFASVDLTGTALAHSWSCAMCFGIEFLGDRLVTVLEQYALGAFTPTGQQISGPVVKDGFPAVTPANTDLTAVEVLGTADDDRDTIVLWHDPTREELFQVDTAGHATPAVRGQIIAPLTDVSSAPGRAILVYGGTRQPAGGKCRASDTVAVISLTTHTQRLIDLPTTSGQPWRILGAWADDHDTIYAAATTQPSKCSSTSQATTQPNVAPRIYRLDTTGWHQTGVSAVVATASASGWTAIGSGTIPTQSIGSENSASFTIPTLIATAGSTRITLATNVTAYAWSPTTRLVSPTPGSSPSTPAASTDPAATPTTPPRLGGTFAPDQEGFGQPQPGTIFMGGDPSGLVKNIHWQSWGGPSATGTASALYAPGIIADGTVEPARITAFNLGTCHGQPAYTAVEWYFPQHNQTFDPHTYINACTGAPKG